MSLNSLKPKLNFQIRLINPETEYVQKLSADLFSEDFDVMLEAPAWKLQLEPALIIDALHMFTAVFVDRQKSSAVRIIAENKNSLQCSEPGSWEHGLSIVNLLKSVSITHPTIYFLNISHRKISSAKKIIQHGLTGI